MKLNPEQIEQAKAKLAEIRRQRSSGELEQKELIHALVNNPVTQTILGAGDKLGNQLGAILTTVTGGAVPYKPIKSGEGFFYDAGGIGTEVVETLLPATGLGRIALSTAIGGLTNPENPAKGAATGAAWGVGGEALGPALKYGGQKFRDLVIEPFSLDKKTIAMADKFKKLYEENVDKAWGAVKPIFEKFSAEPLFKKGPYGEVQGFSGFSDFQNLFKSKNELFTSAAKKAKKEFDRDPSIKNTQDFIEQLGKDERKAASQGKSLEESTYKEAKSSLRGALGQRMEGLSPGFSDLYKQANINYAKGVGPHYSSDILESASAGNVESLEGLQRAITEESKKKIRGYPAIGEEHGMQALNQEIEKSLGFSQMVPEGIKKLSPVFGTPLSRQSVYDISNKTREMSEPYTRALVQSQNIPTISEPGFIDTMQPNQVDIKGIEGLIQSILNQSKPKTEGKPHEIEITKPLPRKY